MKHLIELCPGNCKEQLGTTNEAIGDRNKRKKQTGKSQAVMIFLKNEFEKFIRCIILALSYDNKGFSPWVKTNEYDPNKVTGQNKRYMNGKEY